MSKVIDISSKLNNNKPKIRIAEGMEYTVNHSKSAILILNQKLKDTDLNDIEQIDDALKVLLGAKAVKEIDKMDPPFDFYQTIFNAALAAAMGEDLDSVEGRCQNDTE